MTSARSYSDYLSDIIDAMQKTGRFIEGFSEVQFQQDEKTIFAVIRALEIVGEATKCLPDTLRSTYPQIPWKAMADMRDKLIHQYTGVDLGVVWKTATEDIPTLLPQIQHIYSTANS
jgi:uncharacterized protein with HEPN domain